MKQDLATYAADFKSEQDKVVCITQQNILTFLFKAINLRHCFACMSVACRQLCVKSLQQLQLLCNMPRATIAAE